MVTIFCYCYLSMGSGKVCTVEMLSSSVAVLSIQQFSEHLDGIHGPFINADGIPYWVLIPFPT